MQVGIPAFRTRVRTAVSTALADFARAARGLKWTKSLFLLLLDELYVGDEFDQIIGPPELLAAGRYPGALAFAIALRHSWRPDDLAAITTALAVRDSAHRASSSREQRRPAVART